MKKIFRMSSIEVYDWCGSMETVFDALLCWYHHVYLGIILVCICDILWWEVWWLCLILYEVIFDIISVEEVLCDVMIFDDDEVFVVMM